MARHTFAKTWWGKAWIDALENRARLDPNRLPRGRTYARQDRVWDMAVEPGVVTALVQGRRRQPYRVAVHIRVFTDDEWEQVLGAVVSKAAHAAALLDGEMDPGIVDDARAAGADLFPTAGELVPQCSCPDWADPCKHSAAVCYLMANQIDVDPFALLLLRGREREEILDGLRALRASAVSPSGTPDRPVRETTTPAKEAWMRSVGALPAVPHASRKSARPAPWPTDPPAHSGLDGDGLMHLSSDAVERARLMTTGEGASEIALDAASDLARRAEAALNTPRWDGLVSRSGVRSSELERRALAWRFGRVAGLDALSEAPWSPDRRRMVEARERLVTAGIAPSRLRVNRNAIIWDDTRIRLGRDGRWWRFTKRRGRWDLSASPATDADDLVNGIDEALTE